MDKSSNYNSISKIKSKFLLKQIFDRLNPNKTLEIIKYNKNIQKKLDIGINDYKTYKKIEIEIAPIYKDDKINYFIKIPFDKKSYYHIYFDDEINEINKNYFTKDDNIKKIKIIIDEEITSFEELFYKCEFIEKINFVKFNRNNINNMSSMFYGCLSLKELNLNNFDTSNVTNMNSMFYLCSSLKKLNLNSFNTSKVTNMNRMFSRCNSLKGLNINNFNTHNVTDMSEMFYKCSALKELYISNFNTNKVTNMNMMFYKCSSLKELNINKFNINNAANIFLMFSGCSDEFKKKIKNQFKNISDNAFEDDDSGDD